LRVWTRRADAAIELYRDLLPKWRAAWIEEQLTRIRKATNDARDDDVFAQRLEGEESPAAVKLLQQVREHRTQAQQAVLEVYSRLTKKKGRFSRCVEKLLKRVRLRGKRRKSKEPTYRAWAEDCLRPILEEFFEMADSDLHDAETLHQFRIVGKSLRYAMELLSGAFDSQLRKKAYPQLESLQDRLGKVNDRASAAERIRRWIEENEDQERAVYLTEMLNNELEAFKETSDEFADWWTPERRQEMRSAFDEALDRHSSKKTA
jgi:CHAD domain-containing protein